jgi:GTP cyclohydrolase IA
MANSKNDNGSSARPRVKSGRAKEAALIERSRLAEAAVGRAETRVRDEATPLPGDTNHTAEFERTVRRQLELIGEDPDREGLKNTPARVAKSLSWLTRGYGLDAAQVIGDALFDESHENMVMVRDIELYSLCEHHMLPFFGRVHIGYIPRGRIVGLSKLPRVVEVFARRLQVQERLTEQIAGAIESVLRPYGVGVVIEAQHLCMMMRGVEKQNSKAITSAIRGTFRSDAKTRDEFFRLAYGPWPSTR